MKRRALLFLTAVMVFLCAFSALADGVEMTFSISVYDRTTGTYLLENRVVTAEAPFTYVDTLSILSEQYGISAECDEKGWPTAVYGTDASVQSSGTASFYIKVNGAVMDEWQADEFVENGCIIEWIFSEQAPDFSGKNIFETNAAIVWNEKQASALKEAGGWLARQSGESAGYCMALSAAGQPIRSGFVVSLPNRDFAKKDPCSVAEELLLLSVCGYGEDTPAVQTCLALLSKAQIDKRDVMLCSMILRAYDCRRYELPAETKNTREALTRYLLVAQNEDGGFGKTRGFASSFEATAEAVAALSMYDDVQAEDAVRRGVSYLSGWLRENGIAPAGELSSAQTAARAVTAMACVGLDPQDNRFFVEEKTLVEELLSYQNADGGFAPKPGEQSDILSTQDAVTALAALRAGGSPYRFDKAEKAAESRQAGQPAAYTTPDVEEFEGEPSDGFLIGGLICAGFLVLSAFFAVLWNRRRS